MSCPSPVSDAGSFRKGVNRRKNPAPFRAPLDIGHCNVDDGPGAAPVKGAASSAALTAASAAAATASTAAAAAVSAVESPVTPPATPAVSAAPCPLPPPAEDLLAGRATRVRKVIHRTKRTRTELQGPCSNCGTTTSPQWRKGPKNKPILCNACGIRFHRNKTLDIPPPRTPGVKRKAVITMGHPLAAYYPPSRSEWAGAASSSAGVSRLTSWGQGPLAGGLKRVRGAPAGGHGSSGEDEVTAPRSPRRRTLSSKALEALNLSGMPLTRPHDPHALGGMRHVHSHIDLLACAADMLEEMDPDTESEGGGEAYWQDPADLLPEGAAALGDREEGAGQDAGDTPSTTTTSSGGAAAAAVSAVTIKEEGTSAAPVAPGAGGLTGAARASSLLAALPPRPPAPGSLMKRVASTPSLFVGRPATPLLPAAPPLCATPPPPSPAKSAGGDPSSCGAGIDMDTPDYMSAVMALKQRTGSIDMALDMLLRGGSDLAQQPPGAAAQQPWGDLEDGGDYHQKRLALLQAAAAQQQQQEAAERQARKVVVPRSRTRGPSSRMHRVASAPSAGGLAAMDVEQPVTAAEAGLASVAAAAAAAAGGMVGASRCGGLGQPYLHPSQQQQQDREGVQEAPLSPAQAPPLPYPRAQHQQQPRQQWDASTLSDADAAVEVAAAAVQHLMV